MKKSIYFITIVILNLQLLTHPESQTPDCSPSPLHKAYDILTTFIAHNFDDNQITQLVDYLEEPTSPKTYKSRILAMDIAAINFHPSQNLPRIDHKKKTIFEFLGELHQLDN